MYNIVGEFMKKEIAYIENELTNKIDLSKFKPIIYDAMNHDYISFGEKVGNAFSDGKLLEK